MKKFIIISPPWDKRHSNPSKNYGIHSAEIRMILKGKLGAVQFLIFTGKFQRHVTNKLTKNKIIRKYCSKPFKSKKTAIKELSTLDRQLNSIGAGFTFTPMPADIGYHSPKPMYEGHEAMGSKVRLPGEYEEYRFGQLNEDGTEKVYKLPKYGPAKVIPRCKHLGKPCYYDGSGLQAQKVWDVVKVLPNPEQAIWTYLRNYYTNVFGELK